MSAEEKEVTTEGPTQEPAGDAPARAPKSDPEPRSAEEIRSDIDSTRDDMGDTVEALAAKTDVKGQARARVEDAKRTVKDKREEFTAKAKGATSDDAQQAGQQVLEKIKANPVPVGIAGAVVVGFLLGRVMSR